MPGMRTAIGCVSLDDTGRRGEAFDGANALLKPPSKFGGPVLELAVETEIVAQCWAILGLNWDWRPTAMRSAWPFSRMASACWASRMMPTAIDAMPASLRTRSA